MKRFISLALLCMSFVVAMAGTKPLKLKVKTPGSLPELIKAYQESDVTSLSISGTLNTADIKCLQHFVSYDKKSPKAKVGKLEVLNLSQASLCDFNSGVALCYLLKNAVSLKHVTVGDIFYLASGSFHSMPNLESVDFEGFIGHMDGYMFNELPRLKSITFHKSILFTGGSEFVRDCPMLQSVTFKGAVLGVNYGAPIDCPQLKGYTVQAPIVACSDSTAFTPYVSAKELKRTHWKDIYRFVDNFYQMAAKNTEETKFFLAIAENNYETCVKIAKEMQDDRTTARMEKMLAQCKETIANLPKEVTKLDLLQAAAPYKRTGQTSPIFTYASPNDSLLARTRNFFNLDQVAGTGDDLSRIKNLLYWVHDLVRHDGSSGFPNSRLNCVDLYNLCQKEKRALNCRYMAIMLCEALLAENIPARYIVCQPKAYDTDPDCHVITVAWSRQLNKWVWVDPTFCAYVTDENGLWLHPGEVRERLRTGKPLHINDDANWNHEEKQSIEGYLYEYMAKNLYLICTNIHSKSEPEGIGSGTSAHFLTLIPEGFKYTSNETTTDDAYFWQAPPAELIK